MPTCDRAATLELREARGYFDLTVGVPAARVDFDEHSSDVRVLVWEDARAGDVLRAAVAAAVAVARSGAAEDLGEAAREVVADLQALACWAAGGASFIDAAGRDE